MVTALELNKACLSLVTFRMIFYQNVFKWLTNTSNR